jgi:hypothetical protein
MANYKKLMEAYVKNWRKKERRMNSSIENF